MNPPERAQAILELSSLLSRYKEGLRQWGEGTNLVLDCEKTAAAQREALYGVRTEDATTEYCEKATIEKKPEGAKTPEGYTEVRMSFAAITPKEKLKWHIVI
eukprot:TRINITY_DN754_c5_g1_i1.p1 TRINITY_DN754_c5_g1~~TRINITY_DN754_c5_g1_i1.p1  ORF type:complete len:102 (+),score=17.66 TRINITY_DN754_c5_g1_i1:76-381(+)